MQKGLTAPARRTAVRGIGLGLVAAGMAVSLVPVAEAQDKWPSRRVTLVVPFGAGTVTDAMGRLIADQFQKMFGQPFIVENRAGAGGMLGAAVVAKADPDGYTILMGGNTTHSAAPALFKNVPYDPLKDFTPIARVGKYPSVFATNPTQPYKTIQEFVAYAKANPGKVSCGHGNSTGHITCETIKAKLKLDLTRVPYKSNPPAIQDLLSNNLHTMVPDFLTGVPQIQAGKIIPLAAVMRDRSPVLPNVPTFNETVIKDFEVAPWTSLIGPARMPAGIVKTLSDATGKILADKAIAAKIVGMGTEIWYMPSAPFAKFIVDDMPVWAAHAKTAGITPQ
jgi:tripartite-type tricarboxylate transporter receptor subunit TctC